MGRRSINTTKSGKYMNPTDQARKEARKKELKKNKKQRQMVRAAVLKGKDPEQLIVDLEKIDQMEYNVLQPSPLNEKVLKDKRKKLKETLDRVLKMYNKDDPDKWAELKRAQVDYERKRSTLCNYYEAVKNAQEVSLDEIPLPINSLPPELQAAFIGLPSQIPLPPQLANLLLPEFAPPQSILKKTSAYLGKERKKEPPGVPPGPPPDLLEYAVAAVAEPMEGVQAVAASRKSIRFADEPEPKEVEMHEMEAPPPPLIAPGTEETPGNEEAVEEEAPAQSSNSMEEDKGARPTSLQQRMLAMAGQDIEQFMREMETVNAKRKADRAADLGARLQKLGGKDEAEGDEDIPDMNNMPLPMPMGINNPHMLPSINENLGQLPPMAMPGMPPMMFRPPPRGVPSLMGIRLPPGPPPGLPPRMGIRLPPGPPPGLPPRMLRPPNMPPAGPPPAQTQNVLSAAPQLIHRPEPSGPTIQAQAQIRNLSADVTRFLPTALRVRRDDKKRPASKPMVSREAEVKTHLSAVKQGPTKDDAYQQFMREMQGLL